MYVIEKLKLFEISGEKNMAKFVHLHNIFYVMCIQTLNVGNTKNRPLCI